jgi:hypothetical protein
MEDDLKLFQKEDDLNFYENERQPQKNIMEPKTNNSQIICFKMENTSIFFLNKDDLKQIMQTKTIKSETNGCGTAPGNLVSIIHYKNK